MSTNSPNTTATNSKAPTAVVGDASLAVPPASLFSRIRSVLGRSQQPATAISTNTNTNGVTAPIPSAVDSYDPRGKGKALIVGPPKVAVGEYPSDGITMLTLMNYYLRNPKVKTVVDTMVEQIKARKYYFTAKANSAKVMNLLETFDMNAHLGQIIELMTREGLICGNQFTEMLDPEDLQNLSPVQITSIWRLHRNPDGSYADIEQRVDGNFVHLDPSRFIHFKMIDLDRRAFGTGLIHALAMPQVIDGEVRPSILDNHAKMMDNMVRVTDRYAAPLVAAIYKDASDDFLESEAVKIRNWKPGEFYLTNKDTDLHEFSVDPRARFYEYMQAYDDLVDAGLQHPQNRLLTQPSALADAQAVIKLTNDKLFGLEDRIKEVIDRQIIPRVLLTNGIDPATVKAEFVWGQRDSLDLDVTHVFQAVQMGLMTQVEGREFLRRLKWPLMDDVTAGITGKIAPTVAKPTPPPSEQKMDPEQASD